MSNKFFRKNIRQKIAFLKWFYAARFHFFIWLRT